MSFEARIYYGTCQEKNNDEMPVVRLKKIRERGNTHIHQLDKIIIPSELFKSALADVFS